MINFKKIVAFLPFIIWVLLIYILLTLPFKELPDAALKIPFADKLVHAFLFGVMVILLGWIYRKETFKKNSLKIFLFAIIASFYGIAMEFVQKYATNNQRSFSEWDMLADVIGAFIGFFIIRKIIIYFNERQFIDSGKNA